MLLKSFLNSKISGIAIKCYVGGKASGVVDKKEELKEVECLKSVTQCFIGSFESKVFSHFHFFRNYQSWKKPLQYFFSFFQWVILKGKEVVAPPFLLNQMAAPVCLCDLNLQDAFAVQTSAMGLKDKLLILWFYLQLFFCHLFFKFNHDWLWPVDTIWNKLKTTSLKLYT